MFINPTANPATLVAERRFCAGALLLECASSERGRWSTWLLVPCFLLFSIHGLLRCGLSVFLHCAVNPRWSPGVSAARAAALHWPVVQVVVVLSHLLRDPPAASGSCSVSPLFSLRRERIFLCLHTELSVFNLFKFYQPRWLGDSLTIGMKVSHSILGLHHTNTGMERRPVR